MVSVRELPQSLSTPEQRKSINEMRMKMKKIISIWTVVCGILFFASLGYTAEMHINGWVYPAGTSEQGGYASWHGYTGHVGIDYKLNVNDPVYSIADGKVVNYNSSLGYYGSACGGKGGAILIKHQTSDNITFYAVYGHLYKKSSLEIGDDVQKEEVIGYIHEYYGKDNDGVCNQSWPHLHFGIRPYSIDPDFPFRGVGTATNDFGWVRPWKDDDNNSDGFLDTHYLYCGDTPQNHSLARIEGTDPVYWLQNDKAYHIVPDMGTISAMSGLPGWNHICDYPEEVLQIDPLPEEGVFVKGADFIKANSDSDDLLIKLPDDPKVYLMENGERRWITTEAVFTILGYNLDNIIVVTQAILDLIPEGDPITTNIDVALIIDSSGSMSWNDPQDLRKEAAKIFIDTAQNNDQIAIVDFDSWSYLRWPLQPLTENRDSIKSAVDLINSSGGTSLSAGLLEGYNQLNSSTQPYKKAAVFLTDGMGSYNNEADLYKNENNDNDSWPIYTIGLGYDTNPALLQNIADTTGGEYFALTDPNQLQNVYFEIATQISGGNLLASESSVMATGDTFSASVVIPTGQQSATFLTTWPGSDVNTTLTTPSGTEITSATNDPNIYYAKGLTYELYRATSPEAGDWIINLYGADLAPQGEMVNISVSSVGPSVPQDTTPPVIIISNPIDGKTYFNQLPTNFSFIAEDPESAISIQTVLLNNNPINNNDSVLLTQLGENTLTITATNEANLTSELSIIFFVSHFAWLPPIKYEKGSATQTLTYIAQANSTLPIKFAIFNADDSFIADTSVKVIVEGTTAQFLNGEGDTNIRINQEEGEDPLYIVNLHTNFNKCDYGLEAGNEYNLTVYFNDILAARTKLRIE